MKRTFLALLAAIMLFSTFPAAAATKQDNGETVSAATEVLSGYGIVTGDEYGYRFDDNITRAETAALICRMQGIGEQNGAKSMNFTDVPADHWAAGYINVAAQLGIINGYEDGSFHPDENITNNEAAKMFISLLGYDPYAEENGGFPMGYEQAARRTGLLAKVGTYNGEETGTRENVFIMAFNALDIPLMEQVSFGAGLSYQIKDGQNGVEYKTLRSSIFETE